ncbi:calcium-activated chloride channel-domain-containing protein [Suillus clintonianus]|uniref:calcium-activated chloride channel-domain-containing protein n=1 Tax=Suillus clintonianus TaxID=1904413 RepID=UPI001B866E8D|nr:calcium-activated chloride channel-domain-containing protein [Suillus clintonianus]KAG2126233.1 calcium-activated chloride channel-domain-containing protein [Suillus clintonianus]
MPPHVDVVIVFRAIQKGTSFSKEQVRQNAVKAEKQYSKLIDTLTRAGLKAVGRRGESQGQLLVMVTCPQNVLANLIRCERNSDFLYGLPMSKMPSTNEYESAPLSTADRIRLVHGFISSTPEDRGLGIIPGRKEWDLVESVMVLHDHDFNDHWIRLWTRHRIANVELEKIRDQFGDSVALYFFFLTAYTRALIFPAALGAIFYLCGNPYSALYSTLLLLWSIVFVEWWRLQERILSVRWCTRGSWRVEKRRVDHLPSFPWWKQETRMMAGLPVILLFATILAVILTGIFVLEAFVTQLYKGPGHRYVAFAPTILFSLLVPRLLAMYQKHATSFTDWENHEHQSSHSSSLALKVFTLSAMNAYLGLALSAFVYVPFGESVMHFVQSHLFTGGHRALALLEKFNINFNATSHLGAGGSAGKTVSAAGLSIWESDRSNARRKLNSSRLQEQMFAFTVTNQVVDTFTEIGLPYVLRAVESFRNGKGFRNNNGKGHGKKKRVAFDDEPVGHDAHGREEREFLERVRSEVALPEYDVFTDYSEMVTQFGYVALWSTIWPLAPVMALLNNYIEARSDAFKIAMHTRRPIPVRTDTIGPWLESLSFLTWLSALTNSALVYLFRPPQQEHELGTAMNANVTEESQHLNHHRPNGLAATRELLMSALLIAMLASHGYLVMRVVVRHLLNRAIWIGSKEMKEAEHVEREMKEKYLSSLGQCVPGENVILEMSDEKDEWANFWTIDEGMDDIGKMVKDA